MLFYHRIILINCKFLPVAMVIIIMLLKIRQRSFPWCTMYRYTFTSRPLARIDFGEVWDSQKVDFLDLPPPLTPIFSPLCGWKWTFWQIWGWLRACSPVESQVPRSHVRVKSSFYLSIFVSFIRKSTNHNQINTNYQLKKKSLIYKRITNCKL